MNSAPLRRLSLVLACAAFLAAQAAEVAPKAATPAAASPGAAKTAATGKATPPVPAVTPPAGAPAVSPGDGKEASAAKPVAPTPLSPRFQQVRDRIKALLGARDEPRPPPDPRKNPFRLPGAATAEAARASRDAAAAGAQGPGDSGGSDLALLKQAVTQLKFGGTVELQGRMHLAINQILYREGDVIKVAVKGQPVLLRITKMTRNSLTFTLGEAEMTLKI